MDRLPARSRGEGRAIGEGKSVAEVQLFREDVVQSVAQPSMIGVVSKVGGDSDSEDSEDSDDEDEEESQMDIAEGSARICWINAEESTELVENIRVLDRGFLHGDIVAKASDPLGQTGTVVNVEMMVDLELPNGDVMKDVNSRRLRRVRAFALGDYVIHDKWLGRVDDVVDNVTVSFDDGTRCKVLRANPGRLYPCNETVMDDSDCPYFQGQRVRATSTSVFKCAKWLKGSWKAGRTEGIVSDVEAGFVLVDWYAAGPEVGNAAVVPNEELDASKLLPLVYFSHTNWQLGDRALPPIQARSKNHTLTEGNQLDGVSSDADIESATRSSVAESASKSNLRSPDTVDLNSCWGVDGCKAAGETWPLHRRRGKQQRRPAKREKKSQKTEKSFEYAVLLVGTRTAVDIEWQDGSTSKNVDACSLISVDHLGDHDFWPEQYVMERGADGEGIDGDLRRVGVIKIVDGRQRTATVRWLKNGDHGDEARVFESEEVVSVYELIEHPDYSYCLGDVVIRLSSSPKMSEGNPSAERFEVTCPGEGENAGTDPDRDEADSDGHVQTKRQAKKSRHKDAPSPQDLSWVGVIIGLKAGTIEVAWADGLVSKVGPQAILVVNRDYDSSSSRTSDDEDGDDIDDAASWETVVSLDDSGRGNQGETEESAGRLTWDNEPSSDLGDEEGTGVKSPLGTNAKSGDRDVVTEENRGPNLGDALKLPIVALGLVSRLATGLLGLRCSKKDTDAVVEAKTSRSCNSGVVDENVPLDAVASLSLIKSRTTVHDTPGQQDTSCSLDNAALNSIALGGQHSDLTSSRFSRETDVNPRDLRALVTPSPQKDDEDRQHSADVHGVATCRSDGERQLCTWDVEPSAIKHFDCVRDPSDHHFVAEAMQPANRRKWAKKIQQEWGMLESNLPDTIFVRVYEDRMDLLRAAIVGAAGTPYHDGIFIFDLYMPPDYPSVPPVAHYHSGGLRLNPNLYENGKVCLSLLNTWTGKDSEIWHPSTSTILQLLVSIQGLVLNEKPYYNEAGYERQVGTAEGEKNSLVYNENSFLLSCKSMLYLLRRPPRHFETIIGDHFRRHGQHLLSLCNAYLAGAAVGSLKNLNFPSGDQKCGDQSSAGFKLMLKKLVPKLTTAFQEVGARPVVHHHEG